MRLGNTVLDPIADAVHLCIDMQNIFFKGGIWETPWMERVLPTIVTLVAWRTERTIFTRLSHPKGPKTDPAGGSDISDVGHK
jgi:nicotinamidase-related amidase